MKKVNPIFLAILILMVSLMSSFLIFKILYNSWFSFVMVLTFSSGMMTLFIYTVSLTSNEMMYSKKSVMYVLVLFFIFILPLDNYKIMKESMKNFSSQIIFIFMSIFLIISMLAISLHGHHPMQTLSTSF